MLHLIEMKIEKYQKIGKNKYRLFLNTGEVIDTYDNVILKNDLLIKKELTQDIYNKIFKDTEIEEFYLLTYKYISIRKRSIKETKDYLNKKKVPNDIAEQIINRLTKEKLLNDEEFVQAFIKDKLKFTTMGEYRIISELKRHHISNDLINKHSSLMNEDVLTEKIIKLVDKQIKANRKYDNKILRNKIYNNLIKLGYSSNLIVSVLNNYF